LISFFALAGFSAFLIPGVLSSAIFLDRLADFSGLATLLSLFFPAAFFCRGFLCF
jgi:hypothetical protein